MTERRDMRDYQRDLLNVVHTHATAQELGVFNGSLQMTIDALSLKNPALYAAYKEAFMVRGLPLDPTRHPMGEEPTTPIPPVTSAASIQATLTRCRNGQPLIVLEGGPFNGLEITPQALRQLAQHLSALAEMSLRIPTAGKRFRPTRVVIGGEANQPAKEAAHGNA